MDALRAKDEVEVRLCAEIGSPNPGIKRRAKNGLERAKKHSARVLTELIAHGKKHGCGS
jgi:hypothetical protein